MDGRHYQLIDAPCDPKPVQARLPILIGGAGRRTLGVAARWADEWHTWDPPAKLAERTRLLDQRCTDIGRDPSTIRRLSGDRGVPLGLASDTLSWFWSEVVPMHR
jgi:alkanesulfonate monooxygenase SsuD/methylene tetrahydromethanopterin reductase-like flavin-dependent oxidoreductase (luciferase family)